MVQWTEQIMTMIIQYEILKIKNQQGSRVTDCNNEIVILFPQKNLTWDDFL